MASWLSYDAHPGWEVKLLHFVGLHVSAGQAVQARTTVLGDGPRTLPFESQVDELIRAATGTVASIDAVIAELDAVMAARAEVGVN